MPLTNTAIKNAKPQAKAYKLFDGGGLFLLVTPAGGRWWRLKFRVAGSEKQLSLGTYPEVSLAEARDKRDDYRKKLRQGVDPGVARKVAKLTASESGENSFEALAKEWIAKQSAVWEPSHSSKIIRRLELDIFPWLGSRPISEIKAPELLKVLRRIEERGAVDTAHRAWQNCGQIFRYALATGRAEHDPAADLRGALAPVVKGHFAAITNPKELGPLLKIIYGYQGHIVTRCALRPHSSGFSKAWGIKTC
jgi:hypothetical protein